MNTLLRVFLRGLRCLTTLLLLAAPASAAERYALIVSGANGDESYAQQYAAWRKALADTLEQKLGFDASHIIVLFDGGEGNRASTAAGVRQALDKLRARVNQPDLLFVFLTHSAEYES